MSTHAEIEKDNGPCKRLAWLICWNLLPAVALTPILWKHIDQAAFLSAWCENVLLLTLIARSGQWQPSSCFVWHLLTFLTLGGHALIAAIDTSLFFLIGDRLSGPFISFAVAEGFSNGGGCSLETKNLVIRCLLLSIASEAFVGYNAAAWWRNGGGLGGLTVSLWSRWKKSRESRMISYQVLQSDESPSAKDIEQASRSRSPSDCEEAATLLELGKENKVTLRTKGEAPTWCPPCVGKRRRQRNKGRGLYLLPVVLASAVVTHYLRSAVVSTSYAPIANALRAVHDYYRTASSPQEWERSAGSSPFRLTAEERKKSEIMKASQLSAEEIASHVGEEKSNGCGKGKKKKRPNVIFILNESLGNFFAKAPDGQPLSSHFYTKNIYRQDGDGYGSSQSAYFDVRDARAASGNTATATPAVLTGMYVSSPNDAQHSSTTIKKKRRFAEAIPFAGLAKEHNYSTALFSSYDTHYDGAWHELNDIFDQFDHVVSKTTLRAKAVNDMGMDDRITEKLVLDHLREERAASNRVKKDQDDKEGRKKSAPTATMKQLVDPPCAAGQERSEEDNDDDEEQEQDRPFFLLVIFNNLHSPFFGTETFHAPTRSNGEPVDDTEVEIARAQHSLNLTDAMTASIITYLEQEGLLDNTLIAFTADHGETPGKTKTRIAHPTSEVLSVPLWFHLPKGLIAEDDVRLQNLRLNVRERLVSNLDVVPTLMDLLGWIERRRPRNSSSTTKDTEQSSSSLSSSTAADELYHDTDDSIFHGQSLLSHPLAQQRWITGWQGFPFVTRCDWNWGYVANASHTLWVSPTSMRLDIVDPTKNAAHITSSVEWDDLTGRERLFWLQRFEDVSPSLMQTTLLDCGMPSREELTRVGHDVEEVFGDVAMFTLWVALLTVTGYVWDTASATQAKAQRVMDP